MSRNVYIDLSTYILFETSDAVLIELIKSAETFFATVFISSLNWDLSLEMIEVNINPSVMSSGKRTHNK